MAVYCYRIEPVSWLEESPTLYYTLSVLLFIVIVVIIVSSNIHDSLSCFFQRSSTPGADAFVDALHGVISAFHTQVKGENHTHRNVPIPISTTIQLILASRSLPVFPDRPPLFIIPEVLRFHHCHGDSAKMTFTNPSNPKLAIPLIKCSVQVTFSSSVKIGSIFLPTCASGFVDITDNGST